MAWSGWRRRASARRTPRGRARPRLPDMSSSGWSVPGRRTQIVRPGPPAARRPAVRHTARDRRVADARISRHWPRRAHVRSAARQTPPGASVPHPGRAGASIGPEPPHPCGIPHARLGSGSTLARPLEQRLGRRGGPGQAGWRARPRPRPFRPRWGGCRRGRGWLPPTRRWPRSGRGSSRSRPCPRATSDARRDRPRRPDPGRPAGVPPGPRGRR